MSLRVSVSADAKHYAWLYRVSTRLDEGGIPTVHHSTL